VDGDLARDPADKTNLDSHQLLTITEASPHKGGLIVKFDAIPDRTMADQWRQRYILVPMDQLTPPGADELFMHDLIGMTVHGDRAGECGTKTDIGVVVALYELPQGLTLEVRTAAGDVLIPYRPSIVREVDIDNRVITVDTDSGLFD
jgi:16S rRNA processing protein RimM